MVIGILQKGLTFDVGVQTYTILAIVMALLLTKAGASGTADKLIFGQLEIPQALMMKSVVTGPMAFLPDLPFIIFCNYFWCSWRRRIRYL